jgi:ABC-type multidrug transport system fused ATPase/permease subunit
MFDTTENKNQILSLSIPAWRYYLKFYHPYIPRISLSIFLSILQSLIFLPVAWLIKYAFDTAIPAGNYRYLVVVGLAIVILQVTNDSAALWIRHIILDISKTVVQQLREELLAKFYSLSRSYYSKADHGLLHNTVVNDSERVDVMTNAILAQFLPMLLISFVLSLVLAYLNWLLFLIILISFPLLLLSSRPLSRNVKKLVISFHKSFENFSKGMLSVLQIMDLTRLRAAEKFEIEQQTDNFSDLRVTSGRMAWHREAYGALQTTFVAVISVIILIAGGQAVTQNFMTVGDLITFYAIVMVLKPNIQKAYSSVPYIIEGNESLENIYRLLTVKYTRPYTGNKVLGLNGKITLESVKFSYEDVPTLHGVTINCLPGSMTTIVGPNGSGKTTIANLILGFYRPQEGQVYADDQPYDELDIPHLRRQIGVVSQNPVIFPGTILENILYGCTETQFEQVIRAAKLSTAHEFIASLPEGYQTFVGKNGLLLSGGQRQRIAIARAFLKIPKLLILDEPTNHLDNHAVKQVMENVKAFEGSPTIIAISHDIDIARQSDRIYMIQNGKVTQEGTYAALFTHSETAYSEIPY